MRISECDRGSFIASRLNIMQAIHYIFKFKFHLILMINLIISLETTCEAQSQPLNISAKREAIFLKAIRPGMTWKQVRRLIPKGTKLSEPQWGVYGNLIQVSGSIKGIVHFMSSTQRRKYPESSQQQRLNENDTINFIGIWMQDGLSESDSDFRKRIGILSKVLGKPQKITNSDPDWKPLLIAEWRIGRYKTIICSGKSIQLSFKDTIRYGSSD